MSRLSLALSEPLVAAAFGGLCVYALVNTVVFVAFAIDKRRATRAQRRIPERSLHMLTVIGALGALGAMFGLRHKTRKPRFLAVTVVAVIAHGALLVGAWCARTYFM